jgi:hypothetical protein
MRHPFVISAVSVLLVAAAPLCDAAANLNLSKSNINRLVYASPVTAAQAAAILADLDQMGKGIDQAAVMNALKKRGVKTGCGGGCINHVKVVGGTRILLLESPADEAQALAVSDPGMPADKAGKKKPTQ